MNHKKNKLYFETDEKIHNVLLEILKEQKTPTIAEICRRCKINRTTFYLHYTDLVELMEAQQKNMNGKMMKEFEESGLEITLMSYNSYILFARHVKANKDFYRFFFKVNTTFPLQEEYENLWKHVIVPYFHQQGLFDENVMRLRFVCFQAGFTICLGKWVENDCDLSCEEVAKILSECITL